MSVRDSLFDAFEKRGPGAQTASEWADEFDTGTDYVYKLRSEFKNDPDLGGDPEPEGFGADDLEEDREDGPDPTPEKRTDLTPDDGETSDPEPADGTESVGVKHEGSEKLSPDGHEDESVSSVDMPEGLEHLEDRSPEDFEPDTGSTSDPEPQTEPTEEPAPDPDQTPDSGESQGGDGGLLSRLRGSGGETTDQSPEEVVGDAPTEAERERRSELLGQLEARSGVEGDRADPDSPDPGPESEPDPELSPGANGLHMDEDLMATMFGLPFQQASNVTGWDGWELSEAEKQANAELLVAYCQEQNIDVSTGGMLAMSLLSTIGGRAAGYARHRKQQSGTPESAQPAPTEAPSPDPEPHEEPEPDTGPDSQPDRQPQVPDTGGGEPVEATENAQSDDFDFNDSSTW